MTTHSPQRLANHWRCWALLCLVFAVLLLASESSMATTAPGGKRMALVIGNARYPQMALTNPENDARVMASTLRRLGFEVTEYVNLGVKDFRKVLRDHARKVESEEGASVFYYAGHGVQIEGRNYLLPVDINLRDEYEIRDEGVDIDELFIGRLERARSQTRIVILDACRDNPFTTKSRAVRGAGGLAEMAARGALIAYATAPGSVAEDGPPGTNSVFTRHLAKEMLAEGVEVEQMFKNVRVKVMRDTEQRQIPWVNTSMTNNFSFNPVLPNSRDDEARRADLARLQALLDQREKEQKQLESQLEQMAKRLAASQQKTAQPTSPAAAAAAGSVVGDGSATSASVQPSPGPSSPTALRPSAPAVALSQEARPTRPPAFNAPVEVPAPWTAKRADPVPTSPAPDANPPPGGVSQAAYEAAKAWMAARAHAKAARPSDPMPAPAPVQNAVAASPQRPAPVETSGTAIDRIALSHPAQRAAALGGGSERCVALLIRAQLGEAIQPNEMDYLKKECR